jgi:hypothetical protein
MPELEVGCVEARQAQEDVQQPHQTHRPTVHRLLPQCNRSGLKGAQAWDIRLQDFYTNQTCMGR